MLGALWFFFWQNNQAAAPVWTVFVPTVGSVDEEAE
jgi:hypothetical protein